ncbi:hypothetical protein ANN_17786 [Periplaneta americana]|uniref:Uncharacterized protein n=1 Tax=Periplaneta americana TaxID=6978 RepID=A0ABQ8SV94_PERAM|nr:hypothetical protein ANN_17786 [Periplaneta americana]
MLFTILNDFNCGSKPVAQTYDGAAVMAGEHGGLQAKILSQYKQTIFMHCYAHKLNLVLSQSANFIKQQLAQCRETFPKSPFSCLKENYGMMFDFICLKGELNVVYSDPDMEKESMFNNF